jgi:hypothetical protein
MCLATTPLTSTLRRIAHSSLVFGLAITLAGASEGMPGPPVDESVRRAELELEILRHLLREAEKENHELRIGLRDVVSLDTVRRRIQEPYDELLPTRDPWGNPYLLVTSPLFLLVSPGPDGVPDLSYDSEDAEARDDLLRSLVDDIVADSYTVLSGPRRTPWLQAKTLADMRAIAASIETFAVDRNVYPGPTGGFVVVDWVTPDVSPMFIRELPSTDGWGQPILFWSDGVEYFLISLGADGAPDQPYDGMREPRDEVSGEGRTSDPACDIIYHVGGFIQWPEGTNTR